MTQTSRHATFLLHHTAQSQGFREVLDGDLAITMLWIPPGRFRMGSPYGEPERSDDEGPQHPVQLEGFFLGQTPITQAQWRLVANWEPQDGEDWGMDLTREPSRFHQQREARMLPGEINTDKRPVEEVGWFAAREFCSRLSQRTGRTYTLPSEAQWEYACRAGTTTPFHFGATILPQLANYEGNYAYADGPKGQYRQQTTPVGLFPANPWGLHDMHGNVWEWCLDEWNESYEGAPEDGTSWMDPEETEDAERLLRGGSWCDPPKLCRSAMRNSVHPEASGLSIGFRVCCLPQGRSS